MTEDNRPGNNEYHHTGCCQAVFDGLDKCLPVQLAARQADEQGTTGADGAGLGGAEPAEKKPPDGQNEKKQSFDNSRKGFEFFPPAGGNSWRTDGRLAPAQINHGCGKKNAQKYSRQYAGNEKFANGLLGQYPINNQNGARWDKDAKGAGSGNGAGGQCIIVLILLHLRKRNFPHCSCRRRARSANRAEPGAGKYGGNRQAAAAVPDPGIGGPVKSAADSRSKGEGAHQDEHGDNTERVRRKLVIDIDA